MARRRPLHTCATSCLNIGRRAYAKCQDLDGPIGSTARRSAAIFLNFFSPFLHSILAVLSIIDDHILSFQNRIEIIFPKSAFLFDRVDGIISKAELLPEQVEDVARKFPSIIHQFPLLDRIIVRLISWLTFLLSILTYKGTREKEITVDVNCRTVSEEKAVINPETSKSVRFEKLLENGGNGVSNPKREVVHLSVKRLHSWKSRMKALEEPLYAGDSPMYSSYQSANSSPVSSDETQDDNIPCNQTGMSCTYKEMLERGTKEDDREEDTVVECHN